MEREITVPTWVVIDAMESVWPNRKFLANNYSALKEKISKSLQTQIASL